ncbi:hypothetical protein [Cribrihabitans pelagius]|uniref:hypothetical protein n=1 Tax=Cribrihabitans pelagius TaxID=1765746 RepID=UPI003B5CFEB6
MRWKRQVLPAITTIVLASFSLKEIFHVGRPSDRSRGVAVAAAVVGGNDDNDEGKHRGKRDNPDTVRLVYTPGAADELLEFGTVRGTFTMDEDDGLLLDFPEGTEGAVQPVYWIHPCQPRRRMLFRR